MGDEELLRQWREGDNSAGQQLFTQYFDDIYRFFSRKLGGTDVSDLVQRTFLQCVESRDAFRGESSIRTYLYAIARNELYQFFRRKTKHNKLDFGVSSLVALGESPSTRMARQGDNALLLRALEQIPLELQLIVELNYWEGLTGPQLAEVLGIPEGTVRSRQRRALEKLREVIAKISLRDSGRWATAEDIETWARSLQPYSDE